MPENLQPILGDNFSDLMPPDYSLDQSKANLQSSLNRISEILRNGTVYRAIASDREGLKLYDLGHHWSGDPNCVSTQHHRERFALDDPIDTVLLKAHITEDNPRKLEECVDFDTSIQLQMWKGDIEDELYFKNGSCLRVTDICEGHSLADTLRKLRNDKCEKTA